MIIAPIHSAGFRAILGPIMAIPRLKAVVVPRDSSVGGRGANLDRRLLKILGGALKNSDVV
jgi:hypothetical protein